MELFKTIEDRRSVRSYKEDPISEEDLVKILNAARLAPSWKNTQCWRFIVVKSQEVKNALADILPVDKNARAADAIRHAPVTIVACAEIGKSGYGLGIQETNKGDYWYMYDTALAMEHIVLAAHSLGMGTVHVGLFDATKVENLLNVPEGFCVVALTPVGYPNQPPAPPRPRKELGEIVFYEKFGTVEKK